MRHGTLRHRALNSGPVTARAPLHPIDDAEMTTCIALARLPVVAFDETGNAGQALLDPAQPVFVLASVYLDDPAATQALALIKPPNAREAKFSSLRTSGPGRRRVLSLLCEPWIDSTRIKAVVYHKPFMVTTKIVDMLLEPLALQRGVDLYADGGDLATANLLHMTGPVFCGADAYAEMLRRFVDMVRFTNAFTVHAFYEHVDSMRHCCTEPTLRTILRSISFTSTMLDECLARRTHSARPGDPDLRGLGGAVDRGPWALLRPRARRLEADPGETAAARTPDDHGQARADIYWPRSPAADATSCQRYSIPGITRRAAAPDRGCRRRLRRYSFPCSRNAYPRQVCRTASR